MPVIKIYLIQNESTNFSLGVLTCVACGLVVTRGKRHNNCAMMRAMPKPAWLCGVAIVVTTAFFVLKFFNGAASQTKITHLEARIDYLSALVGDLTPLSGPSPAPAIAPSPTPNPTRPPFVAVVTCATAKGVVPQAFGHMALAKIMVPSLLRTAERQKYRYGVFVGVDDDDAFWADPAHTSALRGVAGNIPVHVHAFKNSEHHIPFNEILAVATKAGADYLVRVNDDTEFETHGWTALGIATLAAYSPPNVGVVGPTCHEGNTAILTHDMVHRTHMDIFRGEYYPHVFDNWWLDDWITGVYGPSRTTVLGTWEVKHHVGHHGTRYEIQQRKHLLADKIAEGRAKVQGWVDTHTPPTGHRGVGDRARCVGLAARYGIAVGSSWGSAGAGTRGEWEQLGCDMLIGHENARLFLQQNPGWSQAPRTPAEPLGEQAGCTPAEAAVLRGANMPAAIMADGLALFRSCSSLAGVVARVSPEKQVRVASGVLTLGLRAVGADDTVGAIAGEMAGDRYNLLPLAGDIADWGKRGRHPPVIVDVGGNIGDFSTTAWLLHPTTQVLCFEPGTETFFVTLWNMAANGVPRLGLGDLGARGKTGVVAVHGAMTEDGGDVVFYHNPARSQISAVARRGFAVPRGWTRRVTPGYNLGGVLEGHGILAVHMLKIDCEGCEFAVIPGLHPWISSRERVLHVEGEIHWHLVCPKQYNDPVQHVTREAADGTERTLAARGCSDPAAGDVHQQRLRGEAWGGRPGTDACVPIRC